VPGANLSKKRDLAAWGVESQFSTRPDITDFHVFYGALFKPIEKELGPLDDDTLAAIIGFTAGGPVSLCFVGKKE
jgi:hypothetical protein